MKALQIEENKLSIANQNFEFRVFQFKNTDYGYMIIWNIKTLNAFHISRMEINNSIKTKIFQIEGSVIKEDENKAYGIPNNLRYSINSKPY
ncbi:hypothetical protein [Tenacibaculum sp. 190524A05c]|uniref:hypothetical protein n=1 Tax=Tenacibaculum platacis TaxID=3137852 RepID=UPI0031FB2550